MNSRAFAAASRRLRQVGRTLAFTGQAHRVSCLIPHTHLLGTLCHHINLRKFRTIKPHLRRNQIRALVLRRTPLTLLPHRLAEVAVVPRARSQKQRRPSSSDHISSPRGSLGAIHLFWLLSR